LQNLDYGLTQAFASSPLIGVGFGTFKLNYGEETGVAKTSHITPITLLAETGLLGTLCMAVLLGIVAKCGIQNYLAMRADGFWRALNWGLLSSLVGLGFFSLSHDTLRHRHVWLVVALILAIHLRRAILCRKETL
jgi:O-antigen ligase